MVHVRLEIARTAWTHQSILPILCTELLRYLFEIVQVYLIVLIVDILKSVSPMHSCVFCYF